MSFKGLKILALGALALTSAPALAQIENPSEDFLKTQYGPNPTLQEPDESLIPTVNIADAVGWNGQDKPIAAPGFKVEEFAGGFDHPRWAYVLPNGDVLVAETNRPPKERQGIKGFIVKMFMKKAGAGGSSADRITLLRDSDGDGKPEVRTPFLEHLYSPFGMALIGNDFYVANTDSVLRFPYEEGMTQITGKPEIIVRLPAGKLNSHWTKSMVVGPVGKYLYLGVGSNSNIAEHGMEVEEMRAAVLRVDIANKTKGVFASGLRNPVGIDWQPESGELWTAVNERDELGNDLVPDYMTSISEGEFFGWPYSYYGQNVDTRVEPQNPDMVAKAKAPDYALGAHTASLGLTFYDKDLFPARYKGGAFIGQHGSWNRDPPSGYKVVFVPFDEAGEPSGYPETILSGFRKNDKAFGRPVGVIPDKSGALLVVDDVGNNIWRVTPDEAQ
ncbi:MAG: sorbosone dehydrogenase family protein [Micavibrio sp.]|nr:sorbosone dehydrogenase family protein [Micavibrio sp.]